MSDHAAELEGQMDIYDCLEVVNAEAEMAERQAEPSSEGDTRA